ncbi:MAG TPA: molybdopterin cofactor-binding domain-containing protein, partial [Pyrinomonadaceae bacterium]|nr:molybdopterin cofactor-binding domain-containing protein [Pyrinomonadaceae bacterium]
MKKEVFKLTNKMDDSPFADVDYEDVIFADGQIKLKTDSSKSVSIFEAMRREKIKSIEEEVASAPDKAKQSKYTMNSHSAIIAEVKVDEDLGTIHLTRVVSAIAGGRVINPKT